MPSRPKTRFSKTVLRATTSLVLASFTLPLAVVSENAVGIGIQRVSAANVRASSQRPNSKLISLLLSSSREENAARALEMLAQAREELKKEGLAADDSNRILSMIEDLEVKARARLERQKSSSAPPNQSRLTALASSPLPAIADLRNLVPGDTGQKNGAGLTTSEVETIISTNPELRDTLWEIGRGRLSRDAQNLEAIIKDKTGKTPKELDAQAAADLAEAYQPGVFLETLRKMNIVNFDVSKANLQLKQEYDGVAIDEIANQLTNNAMKFSIPAGFIQGTLADIGYKSRFVGLTGEALATFAINAHLALRIADLYSIELSDSEKEIVLLLIFTAAKLSFRYGPQMAEGLVASLAQSLGALRVEQRASAFVASLKRIMATPAVAAIAGAAVTGGPLVTDADKSKATAETKVAAANDSVKAKNQSLMKSIAGRINFAMWLKSGLYATRSGAETYAVGQAANWLFRGLHQAKREAHNKNFRRFLMTPKGEGFSKLLVLAMNDGVPSADARPSNASLLDAMKAKSDFIINIARSARVCTENDLEVLKSASADSEAAAFACQTNPNTSRYVRLKNEILTFNEIPQEYVADLRLVSREHRLRMADLVLQMQFLDGDRSPDETEFFQKVVAKTLGLDNREDLEYYDRLHSFIQESGGLVRNDTTPTGFTIRSDAKPHPYDMNRGYSPLNAPDAPKGERYIQLKPATGAVTTSSTTTATTSTTTVTTPVTTPVTPSTIAPVIMAPPTAAPAPASPVTSLDKK